MHRTALRVAHISDLHMACLHGVSPWSLVNKRILGFVKWRFERHERQDATVASLLVDDLANAGPDHILVTGDLTHLGFPHEFAHSVKWLTLLRRAGEVHVVPGNHDSYVHEPFDSTFARWAEFMRSDAGGLNLPLGNPCRPSCLDDLFPYVRVDGGVVFIGLSTAVPAPLLLATGKLGSCQLERLERILIRLRELIDAGAVLYRIVFMHHPPVPGVVSSRKRLVDGDAFVELIEKYGCDLVLHGHAHRKSVSEIKTQWGNVPVHGVPSATSVEKDRARRGAWTLYEIRKGPGLGNRFDMTMKTRVFHLESRSFSWDDSSQ